nr:cation transporter [Gammaproteobacteria bacterium]
MNCSRADFSGSGESFARLEGVCRKERVKEHIVNEGHRHDAGHGHAITNEQRVLWALLLTGAFMVVEVIGGMLSGSLALLADAGHMLTDAASLALAWLAFRLGRRAPDQDRSYGYHRLQVLAAFLNGITLFGIVVWIVFEAVLRLLEPSQVLAGPMLAVAFVGLLANAAAFLLLHPGAKENLNMRGAAVHVLGDLLGSVAAIIAGLVILLTGWMPIDPLLSLVVAALILRSAWDVVRRTSHILLEGTPEGLDVSSLPTVLKSTVPGVKDVHHVHAWSLTTDRPLLTMHVDVQPDADPLKALRDIKRFLREQFGIAHSTVQIEQGHCVDASAAGSHGMPLSDNPRAPDAEGHLSADDAQPRHTGCR